MLIIHLLFVDSAINVSTISIDQVLSITICTRIMNFLIIYENLFDFVQEAAAGTSPSATKNAIIVELNIDICMNLFAPTHCRSMLIQTFTKFDAW